MTDPRLTAKGKQALCKRCGGTGVLYDDDVYIGDCAVCNGLGTVESTELVITDTEIQRKNMVHIQWQTKLAIVFRVLQDGSESLDLTSEQQDRLRQLLEEVIKAERVFPR